MRYLFECHFKDGSLITQTQADESLTTPGKNCFFDVLQRMDDVVRFGLFSDESPDVYTVNLETRLFTINNVLFSAGDPSLEIPPDTKYRLIYFKQHTHLFNNQTELAHEVKYFIGWQITIDGTNYQTTIGVE